MKEKIILKRNNENTITKCYIISKNMGDFYILQNTDLIKEMNMDNDILVDIIDNYEDVQLGYTQNEHLLLFISYPVEKRHQIENILESFDSELEINYKNVSIHQFSKDTTESDYKLFILSLSSIVNDFNNKDDINESIQRIVYTLFPESDVDQLVESITSGSVNIEQIYLDNVPIGTQENTPSIIQDDNTSLNNHPVKDIQLALVNGFNKFFNENFSECQTLEEMEDKVYELFKKLCREDSTPSNISETIEEPKESEEIVKDNQNIEYSIISDEEYEEIIGEKIEDVSSTESLKTNENKMVSDRALALVKYLNKKWLKEIFPNVLHKIDNITFFKENMSKFKVNEGDNVEDVVAKVVGGVVHLEILGKNLSKWNNENADWKIDATHAIKKRQRAWRKQIELFKNSLKDSVLPFIKSILENGEEAELVEEDDSFDICIINTNEPQVEETTIENSSSTESQSDTTNIYDRVSLESLKATCNSEEELFELILNNKEVEDRDNILSKASKFNIITNEKLSVQESIKRKMKIQNAKYN